MPPLTPLRTCVLLLLLAASAGCASTQAKTAIAEAPALDPPLPPPRVIAPLETDETVSTPGSVESPSRPTPPVRPGPAPRPASPNAGGSGRTEAAKPDPPKPEPDPVKPPDPPTTEAAPMHRLQPANEAEQERLIREHLTAAESDLSQVHRDKLSAEVKEQFDLARRLITQARDALKTRNFVFADSLAEKAAAIAAALKKAP